MANGRGETVRLVDNEKLDLHLNRLKAGGPNGSPHRHSQADNVYIVRKGEGRLTIEDETFTIRTGQIVYIAAGVRHALSNVSSAPFEVFEIYAPAGRAFDFVTD